MTAQIQKAGEIAPIHPKSWQRSFRRIVLEYRCSRFLSRDREAMVFMSLKAFMNNSRRPATGLTIKGQVLYYLCHITRDPPRLKGRQKVEKGHHDIVPSLVVPVTCRVPPQYRPEHLLSRALSMDLGNILCHPRRTDRGILLA